MGGSRSCFSHTSPALITGFNKTSNKLEFGEGGGPLLSKRSLKALAHRECLRSLFQRSAELILSCLVTFLQLIAGPGKGAGKQNPLNSEIIKNTF